jgi:hypothetical protein
MTCPNTSAQNATSTNNRAYGETSIDCSFQLIEGHAYRTYIAASSANKLG